MTPEQLAYKYSIESYQEELQLQEVLNYSKIFDKKLGVPTQIHEVNVLGDGNCLFRCISHVLYGDQKHHDIVRKNMIQYAKDNKQVFKHSANLDSSIERWIGRMINYGNKEFGIMGEFGDSFAIELISWMLEQPIIITIQSRNSSIVDVTGEWFSKPAIRLRLCNMHYTLLL